MPAAGFVGQARAYMPPSRLYPNQIARADTKALAPSIHIPKSGASFPFSSRTCSTALRT